jgi:hypothetical protein
MNHKSEWTRVFTFRAIELFARNELIALRMGWQAMHSYLTRVSLVTGLTAGVIYHIAVLAALAAVLA